MSISLPKRRARGFTLIELMVTVAIIGILVRIAFPIYTQSVKKSRRADAKTALIDLAQREERYNSTANTYTIDPIALGYNSGTTLPISVLTGSTAFYSMTVVQVAATANTVAGFKATATPIGGQATDTCGSYSLDNTGAQTVTGGTLTAADCW